MVQTERIEPPPALLSPCEPPKSGELKTNGDLIRFASAAVRAYEECAAKVAALCEFYRSED